MTYSRNPDIAFRIIDGEAVLVDPKAGTTFVLNAVGSCVWSVLESAGIETLVERVCHEFSATADDARSDIESFLLTLVEKRLAFSL
jgi:hypothetical protein